MELLMLVSEQEQQEPHKIIGSVHAEIQEEQELELQKLFNSFGLTTERLFQILDLFPQTGLFLIPID